MCRNARCCPASGTVVPSQAPAALAASPGLRGTKVFGSRRDLDETLSPYGGDKTRKMAAALKTVGPAHAAKHGTKRIQDARRLADVLMDRCGDGAVKFSDKEGAALLTALHDWPVRDYLACAAAEEDGAERLLTLAKELARRSPDDEHRLAPYSLAAWAAWALGRPSLAQCAVDRALAVDADYNFASLIRAGLRHGISADSVRTSAESTRRELDGEVALSMLDDGKEAIPIPPLPAAPLPTQRGRRKREGSGS
jgi:hypothetical protein